MILRAFDEVRTAPGTIGVVEVGGSTLRGFQATNHSRRDIYESDKILTYAPNRFADLRGH